MSSTERHKFATRVNAETLSRIRALARAEGSQIQYLVDEALSVLLAKRKQGRARPHVMAVYQASHEQLGLLYAELADVPEPA